MRSIPFFLTLSRESQRNTLEALIFASDEPLTMRTLYKVLVLEDGLYADQNSTNDARMDWDETDAQVVESSSTELQGADGDSGDVGTLDAADANAEADSVSGQATTQSVTPKGKKAESAAKKKGLPEQADLSKLVLELADEINSALEQSERPYRVVRIAGGLQFATTSEFGEVVGRLLKTRNKRRLSQAALEALSIIAYKQPISKPDIEAIRGINSNEVINSLVEKNLVTIAGRSEAPGKPLLYGTTDDFLRMFGLHSTKDLPKLRELDDLFQNKAAELASGLDISVKTSSSELLEKIHSLVENEHKITEAHQHEQEQQQLSDVIPMDADIDEEESSALVESSDDERDQNDEDADQNSDADESDISEAFHDSAEEVASDELDETDLQEHDEPLSED